MGEGPNCQSCFPEADFLMGFQEKYATFLCLCASSCISAEACSTHLPKAAARHSAASLPHACPSDACDHCHPFFQEASEGKKDLVSRPLEANSVVAVLSWHCHRGPVLPALLPAWASLRIIICQEGPLCREPALQTCGLPRAQLTDLDSSWPASTIQGIDSQKATLEDCCAQACYACHKGRGRQNSQGPPGLCA